MGYVMAIGLTKKKKKKNPDNHQTPWHQMNKKKNE